MTLAVPALVFDVIPASEHEAGFVAATWKKSQRWFGDNGGMSHVRYWDYINSHVDELFRRDDTRCYVALSGENKPRSARFCFGYIVTTPYGVEHMHVRGGFRRHGIARHLLLRHAGPRIYFCGVRPEIAAIASKKGWKYAPR